MPGWQDTVVLVARRPPAAANRTGIEGPLWQGVRAFGRLDLQGLSKCGNRIGVGYQETPQDSVVVECPA